MRPTNNEIAKIIYDSFIDSFNKRNQGRLAENNPLRSAYFLSKVANCIHQNCFPNSKLNVQSVADVDNGKMKGEWLFDFCITELVGIVDKKYHGKTEINIQILFAGESEFDSSISAFGHDFGKLICSNANQYCYIMGLNQKTDAGRKDYIESRLSVINDQLSKHVKDDFVLAFVPTPGKIGEKSYWDKDEDVINWIKIFMYDKSCNQFDEFLYLPKLRFE